MATLLNITGKVNGADRVAYMFANAPKAMTAATRNIFLMIRNRYVGDRNSRKTKGTNSKTGTYVRWLMQQKLADREGSWSSAAASAFKGFVYNQKSISGLTLELGIPTRHPSSFVRGLQGMSAGGMTVTSGAYMPIPQYANLRKLGITTRTHQAFHELSQSGEMVPIQHNGRVLWVSQSLIDQGGDLEGAVLFVGTGTVHLPGFDFGFEDRFKTELPRYIELGQKIIDRRIREIDTGRGYYGKNVE